MSPDSVDEDRVQRFQSDLLEWAETHLRQFPWREPERSFYEVFVAEFLLTQTPAQNVASIYPDFLAEYPSLEVIRTADRSDLREALTPVGFQSRRARWFTKIAATVNTLPRSRERLLELPGVGDYVADATLCFALGEPRPILDRNVERVYGRVFEDAWPDAGTDVERRRFVAEVLPRDHARSYNLALLDFGAKICTARAPSCESCFANHDCEYFRARAND